MAVTSGFFNSINSDRRYDALQMAELFDGLINDGVYETLYNKFRVAPNNGFTIQVDTGRGWFKHTWIKNDNLLLLKLDPPHVLYDRIDAVVVEVDHSDAGRIDRIRIVTGTPSASPARPTLTKTDTLWQVPLAYITVRTNAASITAANITNMVGTSSCPFVTGVVSVMNIDMLIAQWDAQWKDRLADYQGNFERWFRELKVLLDGDAATNLANKLLEIEEMLNLMFQQGGMMTTTIEDSSGNYILDSYNNPINGLVSIFGDGGGGTSGSGCSCATVSSIPNNTIDTLFK